MYIQYFVQIYVMKRNHYSVKIASSLIKCVSCDKEISMVRKCHNHIVQTDRPHHEEEPQNTNSHKTSDRQSGKSHQNYFKVLNIKTWINKQWEQQ